MATLEKIRSKSVLLFVIIIVALLAFILGDFLTSGRTYFGSGTTVAEAAGAQVDYTAYQNRLSQLSEQYQAQGRQFDNDRMSQNVIQELLVEQLLEKEYDRLGITVTDAELTTKSRQLHKKGAPWRAFLEIICVSGGGRPTAFCRFCGLLLPVLS